MSILRLVPKLDIDPAATDAALDVIRERHFMLREPGHSLADEDTFTRGELLAVAHMMLDAGSTATAPGEKRDLLVRGAALVIAEIERADRAAGGSRA